MGDYLLLGWQNMTTSQTSLLGVNVDASSNKTKKSMRIKSGKMLLSRFSIKLIEKQLGFCSSAFSLCLPLLSSNSLRSDLTVR